MFKRGFDQLTAWVAAFFLAGAAFAVGYLVLQVANSRAEHEVDADSLHAEVPDEHAPADGGHGESSGEHAPADGGHGESSGAGESHEGHAGSDEKSTARHEDGPQWDYKGSAGPDHWGDLADGFRLCSTGKKQSPVDIDETVTDAKLLPIRFHYRSDDLVIKNTGRTIEASVPTGSFVEIDGERFDLVRFEFHAPSEHKVSGIPYDLEVQLVHRNIDGQLAVVAVLFEEGAESKDLTAIWRAMPRQVGTHPEPVEMDPAALLPARRNYYSYAGSLTTPPCAEGVRWSVLTQPKEISSKQVDEFVSVVSFNARPVQQLRGRKVAKSTR